ncbi:hypothetical protein [Leptotrichia hongkongensis]|uniref:hypothetical protein n=1 Tax=Leptotrichia hongkongensis TaxID=554406 RepID=UPI0035A99886
MNNIIADEVFILRKNLNRVNSEIEEIERDFEIKYPNSVVIINSKLGDLYKKRNRLSTTLAEIERMSDSGQLRTVVWKYSD